MKSKEALQQIAQMSDCGSHELAIVRMKQIASDALKFQVAEKKSDRNRVMEALIEEFGQEVLNSRLQMFADRITNDKIEETYTSL